MTTQPTTPSAGELPEEPPMHTVFDAQGKVLSVVLRNQYDALRTAAEAIRAALSDERLVPNHDAVIKECAQIVEDCSIAYENTSYTAAEKIRALKTQPPAGEPQDKRTTTARTVLSE